ncbi:MAG: hypothetical protein ABIC40_00035, partial [bacterium]
MSRIIRVISLAVVFLAATFFVCGCQDGKNNPPVMPENQSQELTVTSQQETSGSESSHYLWGYYLVKIDTEKLESEIIPVREVSMHVNILKFLEQGPCTDCFKIAGISPGPSGTLNIDIAIKHPFATPLLTGFDVRGIAMFNGGKVFPVSGLRMSDSSLGDGELMNADGYTTLYNPTTIAHGPLEGYLKGKLATATAPNATLNGFKRFVSDDPANTRNAFYAGETITVTFNVKMPKPFVLGYAIDASWAPAKNKPVTDPMTDFGSQANSPEAWKIGVTDLGPGLTESGGSTVLQINVYDRGGKDSHDAPVVECPEIFDGASVGVFESESTDYSSWQVTITNAKLAVEGDYRCLFSVVDNQNDPVGKPWMDISAYQIFPVHVTSVGSSDGNLLWAKYAGGIDSDVGFEITTLSDNSTVMTGCFQGTATFGPGETNQTKLVSEGDSDIFIARYNPDGSLAWAKSAGGTDSDQSYGITPLSDNSTVIAGLFFGTATFGSGEPEETQLVSEGNWDIFIAHYNPNGSLAWAKHAGGPNYDPYYITDACYGITTLSDNSIVMTGIFSETAIFGKDEPNETPLISAGSYDIFIARYNPDGSLEWAKCAGGVNYDYGFEITTLSDNSTIVTGYFGWTATFGKDESNQTQLDSAGGPDIFIARYNPNGSLVWAKCAGGTSYVPDYITDTGQRITTLSDNSIVVTGYFMGTATFGLGETN